MDEQTVAKLEPRAATASASTYNYDMFYGIVRQAFYGCVDGRSFIKRFGDMHSWDVAMNHFANPKKGVLYFKNHCARKNSMMLAFKQRLGEMKRDHEVATYHCHKQKIEVLIFDYGLLGFYGAAHEERLALCDLIESMCGVIAECKNTLKVLVVKAELFVNTRIEFDLRCERDDCKWMEVENAVQRFEMMVAQCTELIELHLEDGFGISLRNLTCLDTLRVLRVGKFAEEKMPPASKLESLSFLELDESAVGTKWNGVDREIVMDLRKMYPSLISLDCPFDDEDNAYAFSCNQVMKVSDSLCAQHPFDLDNHRIGADTVILSDKVLFTRELLSCVREGLWSPVKVFRSTPDVRLCLKSKQMVFAEPNFTCIHHQLNFIPLPAICHVSQIEINLRFLNQPEVLLPALIELLPIFLNSPRYKKIKCLILHITNNGYTFNHQILSHSAFQRMVQEIPSLERLKMTVFNKKFWRPTPQDFIEHFSTIKLNRSDLSIIRKLSLAELKVFDTYFLF